MNLFFIKKYIPRSLIKTLFLSVILLLNTNRIYSQLTRYEIIAAYIYNFAEYTKSEKTKKNKSYNITLVSENQELIKEFEKFENNVKINNKPVHVNFNKQSNIDYTNTFLIFIASDKSELFPEIFSETNNQPIIIVTENYPFKNKVMLNIFDTKDNKLLFEINKAKFYERKIEVSDKILLAGGTEIDLIEMYIKSQKKLNETENKLKKLQLNIQKLNSEYLKTQKNVEYLQKQINKQKQLIDSQRNEQNYLLSSIRDYKNIIDKQKQRFLNENKKLTILTDSLNKSKIKLEKQKYELSEVAQNLTILKNEIKIKNQEIKKQKTKIGQQTDLINKKKKINQLFIVIVILFFLIVIILLNDIFLRKRKNKQLKEQKKEIAAKNLIIADHLEKKKLINNLLKKKNEELSGIIKQLKDTQQQLIQSEKMASLGILTAGIAHEINNPINFVYAGINSLQKDFKDIEIIINKIKDLNPDDKNLRNKVSEIQKMKEELYFDEAIEAIPQTITDITIGANRTAEIVSGLRKFSRMDEKNLVLSNIHEYLQIALLMLKNKYKNKIKISRIYNEELPEIYCNPGKITQVFMNLIYNAIDAIFEKNINNGNIIIKTFLKDEKIYISVKDNGKGIDNKTLKRIFDPFFTTKEIGKGTGLGLSVSYGIIKEHKGDIKVKSEVGIGTEFIVILPVKP